MKNFSLGILLFLLFLLAFQKSFAQSTTSAQMITSVQYDLPYTGILPDNPLYFLKALRDNALSLFITDPVKKASYDLLMADKRLGGAATLLDKKKDDLAITTLSKSGNYFYQAIQQAVIAKKQGEDTSDIVSKLVTASEKHQEIISQMVAKANGATQKNLEALLNRTKEFEFSAQGLKPNR